MKRLLLTMLLLPACSTWQQKDFQREIEKERRVEVRVDVDKELRDKFEVQPALDAPRAEVSPSAPTPKKSVVKLPQKKGPSKRIKASPQEVPEVGLQVVAKPVIPEDYPKDLESLNERAEKVWAQYTPNHRVDDKFFLDIHYLGMTVGKIMFTNKGKKMINNQEVWHFHARFKSAPFYSNIYELDDTVDTYVTTDQFLSTRYSLIQRESKQDVDDLQLHDRESLKTFWFYKQKKKDGTIRLKQKEAYIPFFSTDPFSVVFLFQGLPLKNGDVFEIPIINKAKVTILKSVVEGRENIEIENGKMRRAIRIHATTKYTGEHLKDGDLYLWFSDDDRRTLLKAKAKIKIGSVTADIVDD